eukprot:12925952-Prorocentrum_lima.AAC.1
MRALLGKRPGHWLPSLASQTAEHVGCERKPGQARKTDWEGSAAKPFDRSAIDASEASAARFNLDV